MGESHLVREPGGAPRIDQDPRLLPPAELAGCPHVPPGEVGSAIGLVPGQDEPDHIVRTGQVQAVLLFGADSVIGRRDHLVQRTHSRQIEQEADEG